MALLEKYKILLEAAKSSGIDDLQVIEKENVLTISGCAPSADIKNKLWDIYSQIDPNFIGGEVVLAINVSKDVEGIKSKIVNEDTDTLNVRKGPGTELPVISTIKQGEVITLMSRANNQWWLIRTDRGEEGYCYARYLEPVSGSK